MSDCAQKYESSFVSYEAFEVACHALEPYCERLMDSEVEKLKVYSSNVQNDHQYFNFNISTPEINRRSIVIVPHSRPY